VSGLIEEIAAASKEQASGIDHITQAVSQMDKVTQSNAANAEETAAASEELSAQAEQLRACVQSLQATVGIAFDAGVTRSSPVRHEAVAARGPSAPADAQPRLSSVRKATAREQIPLEAVQAAGGFSEFSSSKAA
jgi:methyl-accepting chemotaxis protein